VVANPFIEIARDPVGAFAMLGYVAFLGGATVLGLVYPVRVVPDLWGQWQNRARDQKWHSGPSGIGYVPPVGWILMAASVPGAIALLGFALSALAWVVA